VPLHRPLFLFSLSFLTSLLFSSNLCASTVLSFFLSTTFHFSTILVLHFSLSRAAEPLFENAPLCLESLLELLHPRALSAIPLALVTDLPAPLELAQAPQEQCLATMADGGAPSEEVGVRWRRNGRRRWARQNRVATRGDERNEAIDLTGVMPKNKAANVAVVWVFREVGVKSSEGSMPRESRASSVARS
jgi:hypothetical protein